VQVGTAYRLVVRIDPKYSESGVSFQDLIQEGSLPDPCRRKFERKRAYSFSTYALWWSPSAITAPLLTRARKRSVCRFTSRNISRIKKNTKVLSQEVSRKPTEEGDR